jgi:hypothetical protein
MICFALRKLPTEGGVENGMAIFRSQLLDSAIPKAGPQHLRTLAAWYREFAERAGNPVIWEARLRTAQDLEAEADQIEQRHLTIGLSRPRARLGP